ncbi:MAG: hypothetical protein KBA91_02335 [Candidatus Moranbacteria bacterium]|nr:hypothetical protein [Candidatus Moranbacteria bacterium]
MEPSNEQRWFFQYIVLAGQEFETSEDDDSRALRDAILRLAEMERRGGRFEIGSYEQAFLRQIEIDFHTLSALGEILDECAQFEYCMLLFASMTKLRQLFNILMPQVLAQRSRPEIFHEAVLRYGQLLEQDAREYGDLRPENANRLQHYSVFFGIRLPARWRTFVEYFSDASTKVSRYI